MGAVQKRQLCILRMYCKSWFFFPSFFPFFFNNHTPYCEKNLHAPTIFFSLVFVYNYTIHRKKITQFYRKNKSTQLDLYRSYIFHLFLGSIW